MFSGDLDLASNDRAFAHVVNGLTLNDVTVRLANGGGLLFDNTETLSGTGTVVFGKLGYNYLTTYNSTYNNPGALVLTIGSGITLRGSAGKLSDGYDAATIINQGTITADDSGGSSGSFTYDTDFSGGATYSTSAVIDTSAATNPAPAGVYQTARYGGNFSYALMGLTPGDSYTVRMHFAENFNSAAGLEVFNVTINGTQVLTNFDIFAAAGGEYKAVVEAFTTMADGNGNIAVGFSPVTGSAQINGIEVLSGSTTVQAINCGLLSGTISVQAGSFTNQGSLAVSNGEALSVSGLVGNIGAVTVSGSGSSLTLNGTSYVNNQPLSAGAGTTLTLDGGWRNTSTITASNAMLKLGNSTTWSNTGTINATNSTVNLGGTFTTANIGTISRTGGAVNITGILDNTGGTLAFNAATGSWNLSGGTIKGGTITESSGAELVFTSLGGTLNGVMFSGDLDLASNSGAFAHVVNGLTLNNVTVWLGNGAGSGYGGELYFDNTETLGGTGTVVFGRGTFFTYNSTDNNPSALTLTIGSGITVHGSSGAVSDAGYPATVINQGTITADGSGGGSGSFSNDLGFSESYTSFTSAVIDTSTVTNPAPAAVYQTARYDYVNFNYALVGLTPGASYTVRLHFADFFDSAAGENVFNVMINGTQVLTNFDIYMVAGGEYKAVVEAFTAVADSNGYISVGFSSVTGAAQINGIEVLSGNTTVQAINCGLLAGITLNPSSFTNRGTVQAGGGGYLSISNFAPNAGLIAVGAGGTASVNGAFNAGTGTVSINIGGTAASQFGHLTISGPATLGGTLNLAVVNGFSPAVGNTFPVETFGSHIGQFTTINGLTIGNGNQFTVTYNPSNLTLGVAAVPAPFLTIQPSNAPPANLTGQPNNGLQISAVNQAPQTGPAAQVEQAGTAFQLQFATTVGKTYWIEGSSDFVNWTVLSEHIAGTGGVMMTVDSISGGLMKQYFYRVRETQ